MIFGGAYNCGWFNFTTMSVGFVKEQCEFDVPWNAGRLKGLSMPAGRAHSRRRLLLIPTRGAPSSTSSQLPTASWNAVEALVSSSGKAAAPEQWPRALSD